jgi:hypothetical protein
VIIGTVWLQALLFPLYIFAPHYIVLGAITALIFMTSPIYNVVQFSYRLSLIPDALQGRVNSTFRLLAFGFQPLGQAVTGILIERIGGVGAVILYTILMLGLAVLTAANAHVRQARPIGEAH